MFEWKRKQLENEQIKFFGGECKKFVSCYARKEKPRIRVKNKSTTSSLTELSQAQGLGLLQAQGLLTASHYAQQQIALANMSARSQMTVANYGNSMSALGGLSLASAFSPK